MPFVNDKKIGKKNTLINKILLFVFSIVLIAYFFPREAQFQYVFQKGKPWKYELLTAPFDFPIYKSEEVLQRERDSVTRSFLPYFKMDLNVGTARMESLKEDYSKSFGKTLSSSYWQYIETKMNEIYQKGILKTTSRDSLIEAGIKTIRVADNNVYKTRAVETTYTVLTAYEALIGEAPHHLDRTTLQGCNLHNYLMENLWYDEETSEKILQTKLDRISLANGMVQTGERIIDKGEIVGSDTYNILYSLKIANNNQKGSKERMYIVFIGQLLVISCMLAFLYLYLILFRKEYFRSFRDVFFILMMVDSLIILTCIGASFNFLSVYMIPYAILPIILCTFFDSRTALFTHLVTVITASFITSLPFEFLLLQISVGMTAIFSLRDLTQRSQLFTAVVYIFLTYVVVCTGFALIQEGDWTKINYRMYGYLFGSSMVLLFAYLLIYIFERMFGYLSTVTLIELQNINNTLLRKLSEECPGTFQHSLQVGALAYEAALCINANSQLVRTGAFYHDIGKMKNPAYYTENQLGANPHDNLPFEKSAEIIINHVKEGVKLAEKHNLPTQIIDFIRTHHGKNKVKYFYNSFRNKFPDRPVDEALFTYPGPIPFSKETAILMMADAVEASSRSLKEYTEESISQLVERIIDSQIAEGAFKHSPITFKDVERVKSIFKKRLKTIYHARISYPTLNVADNRSQEIPAQSESTGK